MAVDKLVDSTQLNADLTSVANAIRTKGGTSAQLAFPADFVTAIGNISGGGSTLIEKSITANGTYNASSDSADGYSKVVVSVPASAVDTGTKSITANGNNQDVVGYAAVDVNVPNTYAAGDEGKVVSSGALVAQTSDTVTANDTYDTTLINSLTVNVSGGVSISDGIVVTARNANGFATAVDFYGTEVYQYQFGSAGANYFAFRYLESVTFKNTCIKIGSYAFGNAGYNAGGAAPVPSDLTVVNDNAYKAAGYNSITFPITLTGRLSDGVCAQSTSLQSFYAPGITSLATAGGSGNGQFYKCTGLTTVEIGSVGYGITDSKTWCFRDCTQSGLTITLYCTGSYADTLLANIRSSATAATIIIKASEATTYNGNSYAAGATMITSTV